MIEVLLFKSLYRGYYHGALWSEALIFWYRGFNYRIGRSVLIPMDLPTLSVLFPGDLFPHSFFYKLAKSFASIFQELVECIPTEKVWIECVGYQ